MFISLKNKFVFLAMTKTGSSAIESRLHAHADIHFASDPIMKHMNFRNYSRFVRPMLTHFKHDDLETCCLMREPIDWLGSWYRYRRRAEIPDPKKSTRHVSFNEFVEEYVSDSPAQFAKVGRPWRFVRNQNNDCGIDLLFRYEEFDRFGMFLSKKFGTPMHFPRVNVSPRMELSLSPELRKQAQDYLKIEYDMYERI